MNKLSRSARRVRWSIRKVASVGSGSRLYVPLGHYYSPITDSDETTRHFDRSEAVDVPGNLPDITLDRDEMIRLWRELAAYMRDAPFAAQPQDGLRYGYLNGSFGRGDGLVLHAMLRHFRPKRLLEVGCGWSSACTIDTVERYLDGETELTFVEPYPELFHRLTGGSELATRLIQDRLQDAPIDMVDRLEANDVLFIDSTHVLKTGSDVCRYLFELLPRLKPGVLVHIHDMFWPFEYPRAWAIDESRAWNELYAVRAFLAGNPNWQILLFNDYLARFAPEAIRDTFPEFSQNPGGALWLRKLA
jgi:hypothetical protein